MRLSRTTALILAACAAPASLPQHGGAQPAQSPIEARIAEAAASMAENPRLRHLSAEQRRGLVEFVTGNMLFVLVHELGHTVISEMGLPVLGKEENAADSFATIVALKVGTSFSQRVLMESAKGWFLSDRRDRKQGVKLDFYDEHGLDKQRAYNVVCLMVGSDPKQFKALADETRLPEERQQTCAGDFSNASWSWDQVLKPHRRGADQSKTTIQVFYQDGGPKLEAYARAARSMKLLDIVAEHAADQFAWRAPFGLEMRACGESNARWDFPERKIIVCYEIAEEFAQLYLQYGLDQPGRKQTQ